MTRTTPTKGSMTKETPREIHGYNLRRLPLRSRIPDAEPITYTRIAAPLGIKSAVCRSIFRKYDATNVIKENPESKPNAKCGTLVFGWIRATAFGRPPSLARE